MEKLIMNVEDGVVTDDKGVQLFDLSGKNYTLSKYIDEEVGRMPDGLVVMNLLEASVSVEDIISLHKAGVI